MQRFRNHVRATESPLELRLVASAEHLHVQQSARRGKRARLGLTSGAAASIGIGALALAISGNLTAWATAVLLLPAVFATRLCMALWISDSMRQRALPPGSAAAALPSPRCAAHVRDLQRWQALIEDLRCLHESTAKRFVLRPFRGLGGTGPSQLALRPAISLRGLRSTG